MLGVNPLNVRLGQVAVIPITLTGAGVAFRLTTMTEAATMVRGARTCAGLTMRDLAARADVATSTIARIEAGKVDPTVGMLARLLSAAGRELQLVTHRAPGPDRHHRPRGPH